MQAGLEDCRASHLLLRLPYSHFQGWYAYFNVLKSLQYPGVGDPDTAFSRNVLDEITVLRDRFYDQRIPILGNDLRCEDPEALNRILCLLVKSVNDIVSILGLTKDLLECGEALFERRNNHILAVAIIAFDRYRRDHDVRMRMEYAERFNDREVYDSAAEIAGSTSYSVDLVNLMYSDLLQGDRVKEGQSAEDVLALRKTGRDAVIPTLRDLNNGELLDGLREAGNFLKLFGINPLEQYNSNGSNT